MEGAGGIYRLVHAMSEAGEHLLALLDRLDERGHVGGAGTRLEHPETHICYLSARRAQAYLPIESNIRMTASFAPPK